MPRTKIHTMNISKLVKAVNATGNRYFGKKEMVMFGESLSNFTITSRPVCVLDYVTNKFVTCWELSRKVDNGLPNTYFCIKTFKRIYTA